MSKLSNAMKIAILNQLLNNNPELVKTLHGDSLETGPDGGRLGLKPFAEWIKEHPEELKKIVVGLIASNIPGGTAATMVWEVASNGTSLLYMLLYALLNMFLEAVVKLLGERWDEMGVPQMLSDLSAPSMIKVAEVFSSAATLSYLEGYKTAFNLWEKKVAVKSKL